MIVVAIANLTTEITHTRSVIMSSNMLPRCAHLSLAAKYVGTETRMKQHLSSRAYLFRQWKASKITNCNTQPDRSEPIDAQEHVS